MPKTSWVLIFFSFQRDIRIPAWMCKNNTDRFVISAVMCFFLNVWQKSLTLWRIYHPDDLGVKIGDQDKPFALYVCCKTSVENLKDWMDGYKKSMQFTSPIAYNGLLFLLNKSKRKKSQEQTPCPILRYSLNHKTNPSWPWPSCFWARW